MTYTQHLKRDFMTPQAFSYGTLGSNNMIYLPPYGLNECLDYMLKLDPETYKITRIPLVVDSSFEKYTTGILHNDNIYFLPYNESRILVVSCIDDSVSYIDIGFTERGKYNVGHLYNNKIIGIPYGTEDEFNMVLILDTETKTVISKHIDCPINDRKKWHTTQLLGNKIYGVPRGESTTKPYFPYMLEFNCDTYEYMLTNWGRLWQDIDNQPYISNKKYTTLAKCNNKLYAPPYSENDNFDFLAKFNGIWSFEHTFLTKTSRKYYTHTVASNGKIFFPPAGHEEDWSEMLIINSNTDKWYTKDLNIKKESKKYFSGVENNGKLYYIPRGGCVCMPEESWKEFGDLAEILVVDIETDNHYTIDISEYFVDNTTIEKYNQSLLVGNKIFAFPYGETDKFQTVLIFDTVTEQVIKTIDLNDV